MISHAIVHPILNTEQRALSISILSTVLFASRSCHSFPSQKPICRLDEVGEGTVDWRADWLDLLPEVDGGLTTGGDALWGEVEFLSANH